MPALSQSSRSLGREDNPHQQPRRGPGQGESQRDKRRRAFSGEKEETRGLFSKSLTNKSPFIPLGLQHSGIPATSLFARSEAVLDSEGADHRSRTG